MPAYTLTEMRDKTMLRIVPSIVDPEDPEPVNRLILVKDDDGDESPQLLPITTAEDAAKAVKQARDLYPLQDGDVFLFKGRKIMLAGGDVLLSNAA